MSVSFLRRGSHLRWPIFGCPFFLLEKNVAWRVLSMIWIWTIENTLKMWSLVKLFKLLFFFKTTSHILTLISWISVTSCVSTLQVTLQCKVVIWSSHSWPGWRPLAFCVLQILHLTNPPPLSTPPPAWMGKCCTSRQRWILCVRKFSEELCAFLKEPYYFWRTSHFSKWWEERQGTRHTRCWTPPGGGCLGTPCNQGSS